ncbi:MAG: MotA/TolQ/ExbB proton channel family protein [Akkermansia sp.]|nr:MotA/TolQ/ExbB proton channel family protein [Akkermansia sp.]
MPDTINQFFQACQPFGYPLLACSVILVAAIIYHWLFAGRGWKRTLADMQSLPPDECAARCRTRGGALDAVAAHALTTPLQDAAALSAQVESRLRLVIDSGRAGLAAISVVTSVAPMLGILGTAWGLVDIFGVFGTPEAQEGIALGISKALYTTIFGLAIAVPGVIALTGFERRLEHRAARINGAFTDALSRRTQH